MSMTYGGDIRPRARLQAPLPGWSDLDRLVAVERIHQTKALYCYCMDVKDWEGYAAVFTADAILEVPSHGPHEPARRIEGREEICRFVSGIVGDVLTVHECHTPVIDFETESAARVVWAMEDMLRFPEGAAMRTLHGMGHYFERYRSEGGQWLIAHTRLTRLRLDVT